jgi:hypothetical protein
MTCNFPLPVNVKAISKINTGWFVKPDIAQDKHPTKVNLVNMQVLKTIN